ncbi:MAG: hypothetical protein H7A21_01405 [Spirochaetales bacterium]|nr:hypothetical protein [Leptospiraceae bacterium]MCP5480064.1 hypothetical protein [Spirochaetales bacterium]
MERIDMEEDTKSAGERLKKGVSQLKSEAAELQNRAQENLAELRTRAREYQETAGQFLDSMADYCNEHPQRAALIAGVAGVSAGIILGLMLRGRS